MADIIIAKRLIDFVGLNVKGPPEAYQRLFKDVALVLALNEAMGPDGAQLLNVDANGNLRITTAGATGNVDVVIKNRNSATEADVISPADGLGSFNGIAATTEGQVFNGVQWDRARSAGITNLAAQSGQGVALVEGAGEWAVTSAPAVGSQASASRAAGGAGVRHVLKAFSFSAQAAAAPAASALNVVVRDGASGAGTVLKTFLVFILAAIGQSVAPFQVTGLSVVGSPNTAMTVEFSAGLANLGEATNISGYDAV